ncbi:hypothetical protein DFH07DRAFT_812728 [Mycena maculata]|uniref:Uncharacterized protein n=1 Tax=Mycena maculata TaxID=230809 RepID=A0AAD7JIW2_9AGAR|nr:hypothetical protein DFH07DRAFT_812728 [Mycena maculata]
MMATRIPTMRPVLEEDEAEAETETELLLDEVAAGLNVRVEMADTDSAFTVSVGRKSAGVTPTVAEPEPEGLTAVDDFFVDEEPVPPSSEALEVAASSLSPLFAAAVLDDASDVVPASTAVCVPVAVCVDVGVTCGVLDVGGAGVVGGFGDVVVVWAGVVGGFWLAVVMVCCPLALVFPFPLLPLPSFPLPLLLLPPGIVIGKPRMVTTVSGVGAAAERAIKVSRKTKDSRQKKARRAWPMSGSRCPDLVRESGCHMDYSVSVVYSLISPGDGWCII